MPEAPYAVSESSDGCQARFRYDRAAHQLEETARRATERIQRPAFSTSWCVAAYSSRVSGTLDWGTS